MLKNKKIIKAIRDINPTNKLTLESLKKIQKYINQFSINEIDDFLAKLFHFPLLNNYFNYVCPTLDDLFKKRTFKIKNIKREISWYKNIFIKHKEVINGFLLYQKEIDLLILNSKAEEALSKINEVTDLFGYSMWAIEYETHIKKELLSTTNIDYLNHIKKINSNGAVDFFIQQLILKSESKNIYSFLDNFQTNLNLLREAEKDKDQIASDYADFFASYFIPLQFDSRRNVNTRTLSCMINLSIIDQYLMFKKYFSNKIMASKTLENYEIKEILILKNIINDNELNNLSKNRVVLLEDIDKQYMSIIKSYTNADYLDAYDKINELFKTDELSTVFVELFSRINIYLNKEFENKLFNRLANEIKYLLMLEKNYDSIRRIEGLCIKFNLSNWTIPILYQLYNIINVDDYRKDLSKNQMIILGNKITPISIDDFTYEKLFKHLNINESKLPNYRSLRTKNITSTQDKELINSHFTDYENQSIIKIDYLKDKAHYLIKNNFLLEAASFFVEKYLHNELVYVVLPFKELINEIEKLDSINPTIDIPIIYDIYNKRIKNDREDERKEKYEDFIDTFGEYRPSKIFKNIKSIDEREIYFLKNIAIPSIMDISIDFESSNELKIERLEILNILDSLIVDENILIEKDNLLDQLIFEDLKASFNSSKLYVNIENLKSDKETEYLKLYDIFDTARNIQDEDTENLTTEEDMEKNFITLNDTEEEMLLMPSSEISDIIVQIYKRLLEDFVKNENYGLNKYLSTEIRHDVFFTQMRVTFEKYNLLTEVGIDDNYEDNLIWLKEYSIVSTNILEKMNLKLKEFSNDIDMILKEANSWFNVKDVTENGGMFNFIGTYDRLTKLKKDLLKANDFSIFFDTCISFMWDLTYESSDEIKKRLQEDFKEQIIKIIDDLNDDISNLTTQLQFNKLKDSIALVRGEVAEDINIVTSWLNKVKEDTHKYSMISIIKECTSMFNETMSNKNVEININEQIELFDINFSYIEARAILSSVYISLNNCQKYGLKENDKYLIDIDIITDDYSTMKVLIKNKIDLSKELQIELVNGIKEKLSDKYKSLSTKEGGTGIHKIYNLLSNISNRFLIDISIEENKFILLIEVKYENNDN